MIQQLPDGRFRVTVRGTDNRRHVHHYPNEGAAKFFEAICLAGWLDQSPANRKYRTTRKQRSLPK